MKKLRQVCELTAIAATGD
uniref:Uncharacterized protein n=1 Tax=Arundo donax TaxID=35708 RepID=A0A0A9FC31_ARUDO